MSAPIISKGKFASDQQMGDIDGAKYNIRWRERLDEEEDVGRFCEEEGDGI